MRPPSRRLTGHLQDNDAAVASAAAAALGTDRQRGRGQGAANNRSPRRLPKVRSAVAEGLVACAERRWPKVRMPRRSPSTTKSARRMFPSSGFWKRRAARSSPVSRRASPCCSSNCVRPKSTCFRWRSARPASFPGRRSTRPWRPSWIAASPERAALVIGAMADRKETVDPAVPCSKRPTTVPAKCGSRPSRRWAAWGTRRAFRRCWNLPSSPMPNSRQAGKQALADLPGQDVDTDIVARLPRRTGKNLSAVDRVGRRAAHPGGSRALVKALDDADKAVRGAALASLGTTRSGRQAFGADLAGRVLPSMRKTQPVADKALKAASVRMADREACCDQARRRRWHRPRCRPRSPCVQILGAVGGTKALATVGAGGERRAIPNCRTPAAGCSASG